MSISLTLIIEHTFHVLAKPFILLVHAIMKKAFQGFGSLKGFSLVDSQCDGKSFLGSALHKAHGLGHNDVGRRGGNRRAGTRLRHVVTGELPGHIVPKEDHIRNLVKNRTKA
jgi:hypothetical protein